MWIGTGTGLDGTGWIWRDGSGMVSSGSGIKIRNKVKKKKLGRERRGDEMRWNEME